MIDSKIRVIYADLVLKIEIWGGGLPAKAAFPARDASVA